jgi:hypothetical protein
MEDNSDQMSGLELFQFCLCESLRFAATFSAFNDGFSLVLIMFLFFMPFKKFTTFVLLTFFHCGKRFHIFASSAGVAVVL